MRLDRAWTVDDVQNTKHKVIEFSEKWYAAFGEPERQGVWFIYGNGGNGKGSFMHQLVKELAREDKVIINELEEGNAKAVQESFIRVGMSEVKKNVKMVKEPMEKFIKRLKSPRSARVVFINSIQFMWMSFRKILAMVEQFPNKLFIIISQADGKRPYGAAAVDVSYYASLRIWVEGYKAFSKGRYFGPNGGVYVIWDEGAARYHGI